MRSILMLRVRAHARFLCSFAALLAVLVGAPASLLGCGGPPVDHTATFARLRAAIETPVTSRDQAHERSRLAESVSEARALEGLFRREVEEAIGRGDPCSRHPRCAAQGFAGDDWYYAVGTVGEAQGSVGPMPVLIVGFDRTGRATRTYSLTVH